MVLEGEFKCFCNDLSIHTSLIPIEGYRQMLKISARKDSVMEDKELQVMMKKRLVEIEDEKAKARNPEVIMYSTPDCRYCAMAKSFFKDKGIKFTDYDVSVDKDKAREMMMKTQQGGVPVIQIDGRLLVGFDQKLVEQTLRLKPLQKKEHVLNNMFFDFFGLQ